MFDKSEALFPVKKNYIFLTHCSISPLYGNAAKMEREIAEGQMEKGGLIFARYGDILGRLRAAAAELLKTSPDNLAFVKNTSEGMCLIANGYPFQDGDQIISYEHEYPANHYPWKLQEKRGAELVLLPDRDIGESTGEGRPCGWAMSDLQERVTPRTRIIALSHVQFASGFAANLHELGDFCRAHNIDLVIDAAQSLGCLPVYPEECNIAAVASSGWKWLLGPVGTGLLYTSEEFRRKLSHVMVGAEVMVQGTDYLDHSWEPHDSAKRFEYSTSPVSLAVALCACIRELPLRYGVESIQAEAFRLQGLILEGLDRERFTPLGLPEQHRSGILSFKCHADPDVVAKTMVTKGVVCSARGGYLRLAPHFCNTDEEVRRAVSLLNSAGM